MMKNVQDHSFVRKS